MLYVVPLFHIRTGVMRSALVLAQVKASAEPLDATGGVQDTLLPRKEWMALRTNIDLQDRLGAEGLKAIAAGATDCGFNIVWMYSFFHDNSQVNSTVMAVSMIVHGWYVAVKGSGTI